MENTAKVFYQEDCNLSLLYGKTIAVIGYGSQGHAHALNAKESLGDNGRVIIGLYEGSKSWDKAVKQGFEVFTAAEAAKQADIIMILINDEKQADMYKKEIRSIKVKAENSAFSVNISIHEWLHFIEKQSLLFSSDQVFYLISFKGHLVVQVKPVLS